MDRYDNYHTFSILVYSLVVEAYRLDRYDNISLVATRVATQVVEAYRLDRYDNIDIFRLDSLKECCRSLSFG